jgi:hypothetical protein
MSKRALCATSTASPANATKRRLEVDDAERRLLEQHTLGVRDLERDAASSPGEPRVVAHDVVEQRTRHPLRDVPEREERARRLLDRNGAAPFLDELDQPIRRVEPELHGRIVRERMFVCNDKRKAARGGGLPVLPRRGD